MRIAVQMDSFSSLDMSGDSTLALMREAHSRGFELFHYTPDQLSMSGTDITARGSEVKLSDSNIELGSELKVSLKDYDVVLMRQDPPFDMGYITATHILERLPSDILVVNNPAEVRNAPEKIFVMDYPDLMPETLITKSKSDVLAFRKEFKDIIVKPLYGNGGAGVFRLKSDDENLSSLLEMFAITKEPFIVQRYLGEVRQGDKRVILIDGEPVGAINRVPPAGEARSNMHIGGVAESSTLTKRDKQICDTISSELRNRGFLFVGIDIIGDYLTEINVTSPTGIIEVSKFGGADIASIFWDKISEKLK